MRQRKQPYCARITLAGVSLIGIIAVTVFGKKRASGCSGRMMTQKGRRNKQGRGWAMSDLFFMCNLPCEWNQWDAGVDTMYRKNAFILRRRF